MNDVVPSPRVLVIEDNHDAADSLRQVLELLGCTVVVSYTGPDGIEAAKKFCPDVVVCDIGLPGVDGYGVAKALREDDKTSMVTLIALTGYGQEELRDRAMKVGFDDYLVKPARTPQLLKIICDAHSKP
jgi:CheY-like chemotaxis protein